MGKTGWEKQFKDKKVLIMGLGLNGGGTGTARFFAKEKARVTVTDLKPAESLKPSTDALREYKITYILGRHREEDFAAADLIIRNPDVPRSSFFLETAKNHGVPVEMEDALFAKLCSLPIIGVTGTRGKTTTTMMIASLLKAAGKKVLIGGNIRGVSSLEL
ncbi:MAG: Mur ligase family protein, partial [bacterium]|nr:Mur ligase family protein [bacterium]